MSIGHGKVRLLSQVMEQNWGKEFDKNTYRFQDLLYVLQELEEAQKYIDPSLMKSETGYSILRQFVWLLFNRNLANYDSMVLISGTKGSGKSNAAICIARFWCKILGIKFNPARHMAYTNADVMMKIGSLDKFEPIVLDEAVRFASASDWAKRENRELRKKLAQVRTKHLLYILCFPLKIEKVEHTYLDSFVNYWIDLFARGQGAIYIRDANPAADAWRIKDFKDIGSYTEFTPVDKVKEMLMKHPNFWQMVKFPKVRDDVYNKYLAVREKNVYDEDSVWSNVSRTDIYMAALILTLRDMMKNDATLTMHRIILHIRGEYGIDVPKAEMSSLLDDSEQLLKKVREQAPLDDGTK